MHLSSNHTMAYSLYDYYFYIVYHFYIYQLQLLYQRLPKAKICVNDSIQLLTPSTVPSTFASVCSNCSSKCLHNSILTSLYKEFSHFDLTKRVIFITTCNHLITTVDTLTIGVRLLMKRASVA